MSGGAWTEEMEALAAKRWREGCSASEVAREVSELAGRTLSRSAVIGKLDRMGVDRRGDGHKAAGIANKIKAAQLKSEHMRRLAPKRTGKAGKGGHGPLRAQGKRIKGACGDTAMSPRSGVPLRASAGGKKTKRGTSKRALTLMELEPHHCRWPADGAAGEIVFCGAARVAGRSYCADHCARAKGAASGQTAKPFRRVTGQNRPALIFGGG